MRLDELLQNQNSENPYEKCTDAELKANGPQVSMFKMIAVEGDETEPLTAKEQHFLDECERRGITFLDRLDCDPVH